MVLKNRNIVKFYCKIKKYKILEKFEKRRLNKKKVKDDIKKKKLIILIYFIRFVKI